MGGRRNTNGGLERPPDGQNHMQLLEAELQPKADSQIIVRAIQKVNVVANFGSNSDRTRRTPRNLRQDTPQIAWCRW